MANDNSKRLKDDDYLLNNNVQVSYRDTNIRWLALLLGVFVCFGSYYCFDNPQALQSHLVPKEVKVNETAPIIPIPDIDNTKFNLLYSVYSFPNIVLPFVGGIIIDKIGVRRCLIVFSINMVVGQFIFMMGLIEGKYWLMILGRVVFGLGGENLGVAQSVIISQWFQNKNLAFALGLNIAASRLGSALNSVLTPMLFNVNDGFFLPTFVGLMFCVFSVCITIVLCIMDKKADQQEGIDSNKTKKSFEADEQIKLSDIKNFGILYWLITINCMVIYGAYFAFTANANDLQNTLYGIDSETAGQFLTIIYLSAAAITPFFGFIVDKIGKRGLFLISSSALFIVANIIIISLENPLSNQYIVMVPLLIMGLFYSTYAAVLWPCIPLCVEPQFVGTAFGIVNAVQNLNLAISPLVYGIIKDSYALNEQVEGYKTAEWFVIAQAIVGLAFGILINIVDFCGKKILNRVKGQKQSQIKASRLSMHH